MAHIQVGRRGGTAAGNGRRRWPPARRPRPNRRFGRL